ncbi:hypothetical protein ACOXXX_04100 [Thalassococcus sp. BH17M4-6]|uniref:hypothetical protein n=1 Tax=Thalassococcus sp. BH17M4-6 TaxID=3413148 RepID=UPI003BEA6F0D
MDTFIFNSTQSYLKIGDIAGESQRLPTTTDTTAIWGTNGTALTIGVDPNDLEGMHVDPVIPGFEDPLFG